MISCNHILNQLYVYFFSRLSTHGTLKINLVCRNKSTAMNLVIVYERVTNVKNVTNCTLVLFPPVFFIVFLIFFWHHLTFTLYNRFWATLNPRLLTPFVMYSLMHYILNKANLRDLIAATGLVIDFSARVTLKLDGWPRKMIGHLFYTTSSFVHHFKFISEFKLELQSRNAQFGSKSKIFLSRVTLTFDRWPWKKIRYLFYATVGFLHHFNAIGEFKLELQSRNPQFGSKSVIFFVRMILQFDEGPSKNNKAPLLYYIKLCASFQSPGWLDWIGFV